MMLFGFHAVMYQRSYLDLIPPITKTIPIPIPAMKIKMSCNSSNPKKVKVFRNTGEKTPMNPIRIKANPIPNNSPTSLFDIIQSFLHSSLSGSLSDFVRQPIAIPEMIIPTIPKHLEISLDMINGVIDNQAIIGVKSKNLETNPLSVLRLLNKIIFLILSLSSPSGRFFKIKFLIWQWSCLCIVLEVNSKYIKPNAGKMIPIIGMNQNCDTSSNANPRKTKEADEEIVTNARDEDSLDEILDINKLSNFSSAFLTSSSLFAVNIRSISYYSISSS